MSALLEAAEAATVPEKTVNSQTKANRIASEDILVDKAERAISNAIIKTGVGLSFGVVASVFFFKRRAFPVWYGTGFGMGQGFAEADRSFNPDKVPSFKVPDSLQNLMTNTVPTSTPMSPPASNTSTALRPISSAVTGASEPRAV